MVNHDNSPLVIKIEDIDTTGRLRPVDRDYAEGIGISMLEKGKKPDTPILIRPAPAGWRTPYRLVYGAHRMDAFEFIGLKELIEGVHFKIEEMTDNKARLAEIDENLQRNELNALDRALFLVERKRIYQEEYPETGRGKASKVKTQSLGVYRESFSRSAAKKLGMSKSAIELATQIGGKLDEVTIKSLRGTKIENNQRELLAISYLPKEEQIAVAAAIADKKAKTLQQAQLLLGLSNIPPVSDPQAKLYAVAIDAWSKMDRVTRAQFMDAADLIYKPADAPPSAPAKGAKK